MSQICQSLLSLWKERSKIEKYLLILLLCSLLTIVYISLGLTNQTVQYKKVCVSEKCIQSAANMLKKMDRNVNPCDNFYNFACGNFAMKKVLPHNKFFTSSLTSLEDDINLKFMNIYEEPVKDEDTHSLKILKTMYSSCMDTNKFETESLDFLKNTFKEIGGWPVIEQNNWNEEMFDWINLLTNLQRTGLRHYCFFDMDIGAVRKNSSKRILTVRPQGSAWINGLNEYLINLAVLFGADKRCATVEMKEVVEFVINMAHIPRHEMSDESYWYNPVTIQEFQENISSIPWLKLINNFLSPVDRYNSDDIVSFIQPYSLEGLADLLGKTKKRVLANYMFVKVLNEAVPYLPEEFRLIQSEYYRRVHHRTFYWELPDTPRWKHCVSEVNRLHVAVSAIYARRFSGKKIKVKMTELALEIKSAFIGNLRNINWMDEKAREVARSKADRIQFVIAYPDHIFDNDTVEKHYKDLELAPDQNYLKTRYILSIFFHKEEVEELRKPIVKPDWRYCYHSFTFADLVDPYYDQTDDAINIPAALLQEDIFEPDRPQYLNYGAIGSIVGSVMSHSVDVYGKNFAKQGQCIVEQYGNQTEPELKMNLNVKRNLKENVADNGGIKIAYQSYLEWLQRNSPEFSLPGLEFSPKQLFWIGAAQAWCFKYKNDILKFMMKNGGTPNSFRVVVPFMNSDDFARDFNCKLETPMNPKHKCRIW